MPNFLQRNGVCFQLYLNWFSQADPKQLHLIQLDNGRRHIWSELEIPDNIILLFQPPAKLWLLAARCFTAEFPLETWASYARDADASVPSRGEGQKPLASRNCAAAPPGRKPPAR